MPPIGKREREEGPGKSTSKDGETQAHPLLPPLLHQTHTNVGLSKTKLGHFCSEFCASKAVRQIASKLPQPIFLSWRIDSQSKLPSAPMYTRLRQRTSRRDDRAGPCEGQERTTPKLCLWAAATRKQKFRLQPFWKLHNQRSTNRLHWSLQSDLDTTMPLCY